MPLAKYRVTYKNGSGYKTLEATDYAFVNGGSLKIRETNGRPHVFSPGSEVHIQGIATEVEAR